VLRAVEPHLDGPLRRDVRRRPAEVLSGRPRASTGRRVVALDPPRVRRAVGPAVTEVAGEREVARVRFARADQLRRELETRAAEPSPDDVDLGSDETLELSGDARLRNRGRRSRRRALDALRARTRRRSGGRRRRAERWRQRDRGGRQRGHRWNHSRIRRRSSDEQSQHGADGCGGGSNDGRCVHCKVGGARAPENVRRRSRRVSRSSIRIAAAVVRVVDKRRRVSHRERTHIPSTPSPT
jgi:hypothetical protein